MWNQGRFAAREDCQGFVEEGESSEIGSVLTRCRKDCCNFFTKTADNCALVAVCTYNEEMQKVTRV